VISNLIGLAVFNACLLAAGSGVTGLAGWWRGRGILRSLGVSYLCGLAAFGVAAQLLYVLGASLARWQVIAICGVLTLGSVRGFARSDLGVPRVPRLPKPAIVLIVGMLALLAVDLWFQPLWAYDAWTFWTPKAHALYALNALDPSWFGQADLLNRDYPLLIPAVEAATFRFTGYETALLDLSWLALTAFLGATVEVGRRLGARRSLLVAVLISIVFAPAVADQLASAEADIPLAAMFATAGLAAAVWLEERKLGALALAGVLAAGCAATKIEGVVFAIALFAPLVVLGARRDRRVAALTGVVGAASLAVGILPWRIWLAVHHVPEQVTLHRLTSPSLLAGHADRLPRAAAFLCWKLLDPRAWIVLVPLCVAVVVLGRGQRSAVRVLAGSAAVLALAGLLVAYWTTPLPFHYHLATSARRVITGPIFLLAALTPIVGAGALGRRRYPPRS
jgi:hypothetical protein